MTASSASDHAELDPRTAEILDIVAKETSIDRDRLTLDTSIASLDIASLDMVQAIFALESRYDVEIPVATGSEDGEFATVGDLVRHVTSAIAGKAAS